MRQLLLFFFLLAGSLVLKCVVKGSLREALTPFSVMWMLIWYPIQPFVFSGNGYIVVLCWTYYYFSLCLLTNGYNLSSLKYNVVFRWFIAFVCYIQIAMMFGEMKFTGFIYHLLLFCELIAAGYFTGIWIIEKPERFQKILRLVPFAALLVIVLYVRNGAFSTTFDAAQRIGIDSEKLNSDMVVNVNWVGLSIAGIIPWCVLSLLHGTTSRFKILNFFNIIPLLAAFVVIFKTGSRNAMLVFLPVLYYLMFGARRVNFVFRIVMITFLTVCSSWFFVRVVGSLSDSRIFSVNQGSLNEISSGRVEHFLYDYNQMSSLEHFFGGGLVVFNGVEGKIVANKFNIFVQVFMESGYVGLFLIVVILILMYKNCRRNTEFGAVAMLGMLTWVFTGMGEACNLMRTGIGCKFLFGMSLALCSRDLAMNLQWRNYRWGNRLL